MPRQTLYLWKQAPFLRLIIPLIAGILLQWYCSAPVLFTWIIIFTSIAGLIVFNIRLSFIQYKLSWINGVFINSLFLAVGMLITWQKDISHDQQWLNNYYRANNYITATLKEPLSEKTNSFKANASVDQLVQGDRIQPVKGNIIIYFKKDSSVKHLAYGSQIIFNKSLQPIKNSGNPGSFNYERYTAFQGIYQQAYLNPGEYVLLPAKNKSWLTGFLFTAREKVLHIITTYIPGEKEAGLAEALLVGYKDDLDKTLVQSYSNTGVVHVIAISGMHLGLIYWLLTIVLAPLKKRKHSNRAVPVLIITGLWLFALLAGGGPSILRSAVMFTCIVIGESIERKTFIYNSLAASAFILLCINPFWLWDAGFQLSYTAVLSIVIFMKPIYDRLYFKNKMIDTVWKLMAVTIAAQVLTTPVSMYHFHQFPVYFLVTNLLAVPLSSLIVLLEIVLCAISFIPVLVKPAGIILHWLIYVMNSFIEHMESLPFSLWNGMQVNMLQVVLLFGLITALSYWLMQKNKTALIASLVCLLAFLSVRTYSFISARQQQLLIVYNVPKHQAIDYINGRHYFFKGDTDLLTDNFLQNFHLKPSRILHRMADTDSIANLFDSSPVFLFNAKKIILIDKACNYIIPPEKITADLIIISKNAPVRMAQLMQIFSCRQIVFDASNAGPKVNKWKAEAAKLGLYCFSVVDNGAFVMNAD
ncbi:MAG: ComEC/Rec2 family competence protein [Chitinophagaceae bacterium]